MRIYQFYGGSAHGQTRKVESPIVRCGEDTYERIEYRHWDGSVEPIYVCFKRRTI